MITVTKNEGSTAAAAEYADSGPGLPDPLGDAAAHAAWFTGTREDPLAGREREGRPGCREFFFFFRLRKRKKKKRRRRRRRRRKKERKKQNEAQSARVESTHKGVN